ncbi:MAG TPA: hypothetical protein VN035_13350 [Microbacterium sp.]|nr:hypothetical protein [Microbacterium sp.]
MLSVVLALVGAYLLVAGLISGRTDQLILVSVALLLIAFFSLAWGAGRMRRIRGLTPEAIISPPEPDVDARKTPTPGD